MDPLTTKCGGGGSVGGTYGGHTANFFPLSFLIDFFILSEIGFLFKENYWEPKICCSDWDISKKTFFIIPLPTLGCVAQTTHAQKIRSWQGFWV